MLKKLRFKNFKSFTEETVIDLSQTKSEILQDLNVDNGILKGCCFFGGNATGKTNALNAITFLLDLLFKNMPSPASAITRFNTDKSLWMEYSFIVDEHEIIYYFEIGRNNKILKETLTLDDKLMIERLQNNAKTNFDESIDYDERYVIPNALFVKVIQFNTQFSGNKILNKWFDELKHSIYFNPTRDLTKIINFDLSQSNEIYLLSYLEKYGENEINEFFKEFGFKYSIKYRKLSNEERQLGVIPTVDRLEFIRDNLPQIPFAMESYGNQILLTILPSFFKVCKTGGILAIDEFSSGLHNKLEELLIKYFFKYSKNAQIFFVSHSTNLLKTSLIRPDQVYVSELNESGSIIKKISEEKPREGQNIEKMYLGGVFGGIPYYDSKDN